MWISAKCVLPGANHRENDIECQDYASFHYARNDMVCAALSDGAGSAVMAGVAAKCVVEGAMDWFRRHPDAPFREQPQEQADALLAYCQSRLDRQINIIGNFPREEYSCTLLFLLCQKDYFLAGAIGDGVIGGAHRKSGASVLLQDDANGPNHDKPAFVHNSEKMRIAQGNAAEYEGFMLMSDGLEWSGLLQEDGTFSGVMEIFRKEASAAPDPDAYLSRRVQESVIDEGRTRDDCSLMLLMAHEAGMEEKQEMPAEKAPARAAKKSVPGYLPLVLGILILAAGVCLGLLLRQSG